MIGNIAQDMNLIVNINPDLARPGDTLTVDLELDNDIDYIFWTWSLIENGNEITAQGNGWDDENKAQFEIELERRSVQNLALSVSVIDGKGRQYVETQSIEMRDMVELSIQSAFITNAGDTLALNWDVVSPSLTQSDKANVITVNLFNVGTGEGAYENTQLVDGFNGNFGLNVPVDLRPGTYLMTVSVETVDGRTLTSESVIDIDEPRDKNMILGVEFPSWSSMFNGFAILLLIGNLVAIWAVLYRRRGPGGSMPDSLALFNDDEDEDEDEDDESGFNSDYNEIYGGFNDTTEPSGGNIRPSTMEIGTVHDDGFEWLMYPAGSDCWWYRREPGTEWIRH